MSYLGHLYEIVTVLISPKSYGWGCSRTRRYTILRHIYKTAGWKMDLSVFVQLFKAETWFGEYTDAQSQTLPAWDCFFCGSAADLHDELMWAVNRQGSCGKHLADTDKKTLVQKLEGGDTTYFVNALTDSEYDALLLYVDGDSDGDKVYSLNQNPDFSETKSTWKSGAHGRWLGAKEALLVMGIPVFTWLSDGVEMTSFTEQNLRRRNKPFARTHMIGMAGNSMHTQCVGLALLYAATQVPECQNGQLLHVKWFNDQGIANIQRHPINDRKQNSIRQKYARGILRHGILEGCRGEPCRFLNALRAESFYDCVKSDPDNEQVPLLPQAAPDVSSKGAAHVFDGTNLVQRNHLYHFVSGPESSLMNEAREKLMCQISGSVFVNKILQKQRKNDSMSGLLEGDGDREKDESKGRKRPKAPDLAEEPDKKVARKEKAKPKSKAKGKAKAKSASTSNFYETEDTLQGDVEDEKLGTSRPRTWIDDVLFAVEKCFIFCGADFMKLMTNPCVASAVSFFLTVSLEFALSGSIMWHGRQVKEWSKLRPCLQSFLQKSILHTKGSLPQGDKSEILSKLLTEVSSQGDMSKNDVSHSLLQDTCVMQKVQRFVSTNKQTNINQQPSFSAYLAKLKRDCCTCGSVDAEGAFENCSFHTKSFHGMPDLMWGLSRALRDESPDDEDSESMIPVEVPLVALTALLLINDKEESKKNAKQKDSEEAGETSPQDDSVDLLAVLGKECRFLLTENDKNELVLNEGLVNRMITCSSLYMINAAKFLMEIPGSISHELISMEDDVDPSILYKLLSFLQTGDGRDAKVTEYLMQIEGHFYLQKGSEEAPADRSVDAWSVTWAKILKRVAISTKKRLDEESKKGDEGSKDSQKIAFHLVTFPSSEFAVEKGDKGSLRAKVLRVKEEAPQKAGLVEQNTAMKVGEAAASAVGGDMVSAEAAEASSSAVLPDILDFAKIYRLGIPEATGDSSSVSVDVRDIISIQHSIACFILNNAHDSLSFFIMMYLWTATVHSVMFFLSTSNTPESLLKLLTVDGKHCVSVNFAATGKDSQGQISCLAEECAGDRLFFFGNVTTEIGGPQSLKAGLFCILFVKDFLRQHMRQKSLDVEVTLWFAELRSEACLFVGAVDILVKKAKKSRESFSEVLATRAWFEKEEPAKKKARKDSASLLMLGGRLWAARGSAVTKTEAESSDLLQLSGNAVPKHCAHLLK
eukprot:s278_g18.t1